MSTRDALSDIIRIAAALVCGEFTPSEFADDWAARPTAKGVARACELRMDRARDAAIRLRKAHDAILGDL